MKKVLFIIIFFTSSLLIVFRTIADENIRITPKQQKEKKNEGLYKSQLSLYLMPGYSQLGYSTPSGIKSSGSFSFGGGIGYTFWFNKYIGLGTGLQLNYYNGKIKLSPYSDVLKGVDNSDGVQNQYILTQTINGTEQQRVTYFEIPLLLNFAIPLASKLDFVVNVGGSVGFNMLESNKMGDGNYQRMISFPGINVNITTSESLHLGTFTKFSNSPKQFTTNFSVIGDLGLKFKLTDRTHLAVLFTAGYGLSSVKAQNLPFVSIDKYRGITSTQRVENINTLSMGGKIALNIGLGKTKKKQDIQSESEYDFPLNYTVPIQEPVTQSQFVEEKQPKLEPVVQPKITPEEERQQKIAELKPLLKQLEQIIATKKPKFGNGSKDLTFEVQNIFTKASELINATKVPVVIVCQSCKQSTPKANKVVGGRRAQLIKKSFLDFNAENTYIRIKVVKCKTIKTEGKISFLVVEGGELKNVQSKSTDKKKSTVKKQGAKKNVTSTGNNVKKKTNVQKKNTSGGKKNIAPQNKKNIKKKSKPTERSNSSTSIKFSDM